MANIITDAELKAHLGIVDSLDNESIANATTAASAWVRKYCGRSFTIDANQSATARYYLPASPLAVKIDDATTISSVAVDLANDGTWSTILTASDYWASPLDGVGPDGLTGWPYTEINVVTLELPRWTYRPPVKVTAKWGWTALPGDVKLATLMVAADYWRAKNGGGDMFGADGQYVPQRRNWAVINQLDPYKRYDHVIGLK